MEEEVSTTSFPSLLAYGSFGSRFSQQRDLPERDSLAEIESDTSQYTFSRPIETSSLLAGIRGARLSPTQQAALLQSLLRHRRSEPHELSRSASHTARTSPFDLNFDDFPFPLDSPPLSSAEPTPMSPSRIDGLNELQAPPVPSTSTSFAGYLPSNQLDELLNAQSNLDIWARTVFQPDPSQTPDTTPMTSSFDWSTLYPPAHEALPPSHPPLPTGLPDFSFPNSPFPLLPSFSPLADSHSTLTRSQVEEEPSSSQAPSPRPQRLSRSRRTSKAPSRSSSIGGGGGGQGSESPSSTTPVGKEWMTAEEIEEDKRRRNTEASGESFSLGRTHRDPSQRLMTGLIARFRAKKKQKNNALQQSAAQLREKLVELEKEKEAVSPSGIPLRVCADKILMIKAPRCLGP